MREETLPGGNTTGAVLVGDVIPKPASPWTPTVHAVLRHLEDAGFDGDPRALGSTVRAARCSPICAARRSATVRPGPGGHRRTRCSSRSAGGSAGSPSPARRRGSSIWRSPCCPRGYAGDRRVFATVVPERARGQAAVIRDMAAAGDQACIAILPIAGMLERSAADVDGFPESFWAR